MFIRIKAFFDFILHYSRAFNHAWKHRAEMAPVKRLPHEAQFLPSALSLQETPVSPIPRVTAWLLMLFTLIAILWATMGEMDVVATAQGKIVPNDRTKTIQPFETATVKQIYVSDGQTVKAGDVLIELDSTDAAADEDRLKNDLMVSRLQIARAQAFLKVLEDGSAPELERPENVSDNLYLETESLLLSQIAEFYAKKSRTEAEIEQHGAEYRSTQTLVASLQKTVPIVREQSADYKELVESKYVSKHGFLEREQIRIDKEGQLANQQSRLQEILAAQREVRGQYENILTETKRINYDLITESRQRITTNEQELLKVQARKKLMRLIAPVDGTVQQLAVHTVGGVVTPAQPVMLIVPSDNPLEVEAFIDNKDIGFVKAGQIAEVKVETFQYTKYGTIDSDVMSVSHDAINDEKRGLIYSSRIKLKKSFVNVDGTDVNLTPGMSVTVEIKTGKRRIIEFFLSPLLKHANESLRER